MIYNDAFLHIKIDSKEQWVSDHLISTINRSDPQTLYCCNGIFQNQLYASTSSNLACPQGDNMKQSAQTDENEGTWTESSTGFVDAETLELIQSVLGHLSTLRGICLTPKVSPEQVVFILAELIGHDETEIARQLNKHPRISAKWKMEEAETERTLKSLTLLYSTLGR